MKTRRYPRRSADGETPREFASPSNPGTRLESCEPEKARDFLNPILLNRRGQEKLLRTRLFLSPSARRLLGPSLLLPFASPRKAWWLGFECRRLHRSRQPLSSQPLVTPPPPLPDPTPTLIQAHFLDRSCPRQAAAAACNPLFLFFR